MQAFVVNSVSRSFPFEDTTLLHVIRKDILDSLPLIYLEGGSNIFDRYFKCLETGIFVARVHRD